MPPIKTSLATKKNLIVQKYKSSLNINSANDILCKYCNKVIKFTDKNGKQTVEDHLKSEHHRKKKQQAIEIQQIQPSIDISLAQQSKKVMKNPYFEDVAKWMTENNIALSKLGNESFTWIFKKHHNQDMPCASNISKYYVPNLFNSTLDKIRGVIQDNSIYLIIDETSDKLNRHVLNILVGCLGEKYSKPMLLMVKFLDQANSNTVTISIFQALERLYNGRATENYGKLQVILSDMGSYMLKSIDDLKIAKVFINLKHITCIAHLLHNVCEKIRDENDQINSLISCLQNILCKSHQRKQKFKEVTGLSLPPTAVITRWGTWLETAFWYSRNFDLIARYINQLENKSKAIESAKKLVCDDNELLKNQLILVLQYTFIPTAIKELETQGLSIDRQMDILNGVRDQLDGYTRDKFNSLMAKTRDLRLIMASNDYNFRKMIHYLPLVTVDVERSFSLYRRILSDLQTCMLESTIEERNIIQFNKFLK
jgi:hypothetical protein